MANSKRDLKAFIRIDASGRVIPGSSVLRKRKPKMGNWVEFPSYQCCNPTTTSTTTES